MMKRIYLDYAATTPVDSKVATKMDKINRQFFGNPSSIHSFGQESRQLIDESRNTVADFFGCQPEEVVFTSGGSESDNLAIKGIVEAFYGNFQFSIFNFQKNSNVQSSIIKPHIITTEFEHHAVLDTVKELEDGGAIEATYLKPNSKGLITVEQVEKAIKDNTILVSIIYVNNEIGTVQPISAIGKLIERINASRQSAVGSRQSAEKSANCELQTANLPHIYFHTDAVQAVEYFNINTNYLHVDLLTLTGHKIYGPKGAGVLFIKNGTPITRQISGGGQEFKKRAGTENVSAISGLAEAVKILNQKSNIKNKKYGENIRILRDRLIDGLEKNIKECALNGDREQRSPNNANFTIKNAEGEALLLNLDLAGIAASSGSACTSGALEPSHVLLSIGVPAEEAHGSIRFTLGRGTTKDEIDQVIKIFPPIVERVRGMSPFS